ncbi:MAG TPA: hypothetical protein VF416_02705 [Marmoricola sp.]|jgi:hypothetical protein
MSQRTRLRVIAGAAVLAAGLVSLSACGDDGTVASGDGTKVKVDGDKVTVETTDGTATVGQGLPDGFPTDDVPLVDEKVVTGTQGSAGGPFAWSVVMQSSRSVDDLAAEVKKDYASWNSQDGPASALDDLSIQRFTNDKYEVGVTIARTGDSVTITYVVKNAS